MTEVEKIEKRRLKYLQRTKYWHKGNLEKIGWRAKKILGQGTYVGFRPRCFEVAFQEVEAGS